MVTYLECEFRISSKTETPEVSTDTQNLDGESGPTGEADIEEGEVEISEINTILAAGAKAAAEAITKSIAEAQAETVEEDEASGADEQSDAHMEQQG